MLICVIRPGVRQYVVCIRHLKEHQRSCRGSENYGICRQKKLKLTVLRVCEKSNSNRGAKTCGIHQRKQLILTVFCSAVQQKLWNLPTKEFKSTVFCAAAQRKFFEFANKQLKLTALCQSCRISCVKRMRGSIEEWNFLKAANALFISQ
jgi:aldehyde:ferredoxin oxidoreductase